VKLLLDQGGSRVQRRWSLPRSGIDAVHAGDIGMAEAADEELLARAREDERIVVSLEADFHALLVLSNASGRRSFEYESKGCTPNRSQRSCSAFLHCASQSCRRARW